ncbi:hypothetical protein N9H39_01540 [Gammaproteobacteria bacterium]|nr:hypothetical protein [Gammaproteobacteria bacterium]
MAPLPALEDNTVQPLLRCQLARKSSQAFIVLTHRRNASRRWAGNRWSTFLRILQTASFVALNPVRSSIGFNQINRRHRRFILSNRFQQGPFKQESFIIYIRLVQRIGTLFIQPDPQQLLRVVPFVDRGGGIDTFKALLADQFRPPGTGKRRRDRCLAHPGLTLDQERPLRLSINARVVASS